MGGRTNNNSLQCVRVVPFPIEFKVLDDAIWTHSRLYADGRLARLTDLQEPVFLLIFITWMFEKETGMHCVRGEHDSKFPHVGIDNGV